MIDLIEIMPAYQIGIFVFIFGVLLGSFLNVFLYRFHTGRTVMGSSHCLSCGTTLSPFELVPIFSYLALRGRCFTCRSYIPSRYFLVELVTGLLFLAVFLSGQGLVGMFYGFFMVLVLLSVAVYDLYHMVIPDEFVLTSFVASSLWLYYQSYVGLSLNEVLYTLFATFLAGAFFFFLWKVSRGTWIGFGDVKLVVPLALGVGYSEVFSLVVLSFWTGAIIGLFFVLVNRLKQRGQLHLRLIERKITMKSAIPFAPFLVLAFLLVYLFKIDVIAMLSYV